MKYAILCIVSLILSSQIVALIAKFQFINMPLSITLVKIFVDAGLFAVNYGVQRKWVFR